MSSRAGRPRGQTSGIKLPYHWQTLGRTPGGELHEVTDDREYQAVTQPLFERLGDTLEIRRVERNENDNLYSKYFLDRDTVKLGNRGDANERWLWHGTDALDDVLTGGFNTAYASLEFNAYGVGNYFAPDPRLADFFIRSARGSSGEKKIILTRVACGSIGERDAISGWWPAERKQAALRDVVNRTPPAGHTSATGRNHTEVIVYQNYYAYPAYVVTYTVSPLPDPYTQASGYLRRHEEVAASLFE